MLLDFFAISVNQHSTTTTPYPLIMTKPTRNQREVSYSKPHWISPDSPPLPRYTLQTTPMRTRRREWTGNTGSGGPAKITDTTMSESDLRLRALAEEHRKAMAEGEQKMRSLGSTYKSAMDEATQRSECRRLPLSPFFLTPSVYFDIMLTFSLESSNWTMRRTWLKPKPTVSNPLL